MLSCVGNVAWLLLLFRVAAGVDGCCRCCLCVCSSSVAVYVCCLKLYGVGVCCCCCAALFVVGCCCLVFAVCRLLMTFVDVGSWCCALMVDG